MKEAFALKRLLSFVLLCLSFAVVVSAAPNFSGVVESADEFEGFFEEILPEEDTAELKGDGTETSPYEISSANEFNKYAKLVRNSNSQYGSKYYKLTGNIDFSGVTIIPIGTSSTKAFSGTLDGNGYEIYNLTPANTTYSGVIGYMKGGTVKNLSVSYADTTDRINYYSLKYFGGIVGYAEVASSYTISISDCKTDGKLMLSTPASVYVGGLCGYVKCEKSDAKFTNCLSLTDIDVVSATDSFSGGFAGYAIAGSSKNYIFKNCLSYGDIRLVSNSIESTAGGFVAYANKDASGWSPWAGEEDEASLMATVYSFENCASFGDVYCSAPQKVSVGGFMGKKAGEGNVTSSNIYRSSDQTVNGAATSVVKSTIANAVAKQTLSSKSYLEETVGLSFENNWYITSDGTADIRGTLKTHGSPVTNSNTNLRLDSKTGVRFKAVIDSAKRDYVCEYGFIIAAEKVLGENELTFDFGGKIGKGVAYSTDAENPVDIKFNSDDYEITFSAVLINIREKNYGDNIVARPYLKYVYNGETEIVYGDTVVTSVNKTADTIKNSTVYDNLSDAEKEKLETMVTK